MNNLDVVIFPESSIYRIRDQLHVLNENKWDPSLENATIYDDVSNNRHIKGYINDTTCTQTEYLHNKDMTPIFSEESSAVDPIYLIQQFFVSKHEDRHKENIYCLRRNLANPYIDHIYLLNEREYTLKELGIEDIYDREGKQLYKKLTQVIIGNRLTYYDFFNFVLKNKINGYVLLSNLDIYFNHTLYNLYWTELKQTRDENGNLDYYSPSTPAMYAQLRLDLKWIKEPTKLYSDTLTALFGTRMDSQDTWIFHSSTIHSLRLKIHAMKKYLQIELGQPGCDNRITYVLNEYIGYKIFNEPYRIHTIHVHKTEYRTYTIKNVVSNPYTFVYPTLTTYFLNNHKLSREKSVTNRSSLENKRDASAISDDKWLSMSDYIKWIMYKLDEYDKTGRPFYVPRVGGIEHMASLYRLQLSKVNVEQLAYLLRRNAGVNCITHQDYKIYSTKYFQSLIGAELYASWKNESNVAKASPVIRVSNLLMNRSSMVDSLLYDHTNVLIPYYRELDQYCQTQFNSKLVDTPIQTIPKDVIETLTTKYPYPLHALKGRRILVVTPFVESFKYQLSKLDTMFAGYRFIPSDKFIFVKAPQTNGEYSKEHPIMKTSWIKYYNQLLTDIEKVKDEFDIAVVSCGGYGVPLVSDIHSKFNKNAIYIGGALQILFGVIGRRWESKDQKYNILMDYWRTPWIRPFDSEKVQNSHMIENNCYW